MSKPQRRKGNLQTANSTQATDLLQRTVGLTTAGINPFTAAHSLVGVWDQEELDSDLVIVIKKFGKRDATTREKALREFVDLLVSKSPEMQLLAYQNYAHLFQKLCLDGSAPVRSYSIRVASFFIKILKKAAQKQIKQILPFVVVCLSDSSTTVVQHAENLLKENFPEEKRKQVLTVFSPDIASICAEIITGKHPLLNAEHYDGEEEKKQRMSRLVTQTLQCLVRLCGELSSIPEEMSVQITKVFEDSAAVKSILQQSGNVKTNLLNLAMQMENPFPQTFVTSSPLGKWILQNIDSEDSSVAKGCFDAFIQLASDRQFFDAFDVKKAVIPRILQVIRKKQIHWRSVSSFILPSVAVVFEVLPEADRVPFLSSILSSFPDNLPFEGGSMLVEWSTAVAECFKYALTKAQPVGDIGEVCTRLLVQVVDVVCVESDDVFLPIVELIQWIVSKDLLVEEWGTVLEQLTLNLKNTRLTSDRFCVSLLERPHTRLLPLLYSLCQTEPIPVSLLASLETAPEDVLSLLHKEVHLVQLIVRSSSESDETSRALSSLLLRLLELFPEAASNLKLKSGSLVRYLLEKVTEKSWPPIEKVIVEERTSILKDALTHWQSVSLSSPALNLLSLLPNEERNSLMSHLVTVEEDDSSMSNLQFVSDVAAGIDLSPDIGTKVCDGLMTALFSGSDSSALLPSASTVLLKYPIPSTSFSSLRNTLCENATHSCDVEAAAGVASSLCVTDARFDSILPSKEEVVQLLEDVDKFMSSEVLFSSSLASSLYKPKECLSSSDSEWFLLRRKLAALALFSCKTATIELSSRNWPLVLAAVHLSIYRLDAGYRRSFDEPSELEERTATTFETAVENDDTLLSVVQSTLTSLSSPLPRVALLAINYLKKYKAVVKVSDTLEELPRAEFFWSLGQNSERLRLGTVDRWVARFHNGEKPDEFLVHLQETIRSNNSEWEAELFNINASDPNFWLLNMCALRAAGTVIEERSPKDVDAQLLDFVMCGLITAMDSCDDYLSTQKPFTDSFETFASLALRLYCNCEEKAREQGGEEVEGFAKEWNDFFYPTLSRIVLRWFVEAVTPASSTGPFTRYLCKAVYRMTSAQWELACQPRYTPLLDAFGYDGAMQSVLCQSTDLLKSKNMYLQFAAVNVLRLLCMAMHRQENGEWNDEERLAVEKTERKLKAPELMREIATTSISLPALLALDVCISPVSAFSSHAERVAYCDGLPAIVTHALPVLLSMCPQQIARSEIRSYFLDPVPLEQPNTVSRYACALLFKMVQYVPALVRSWYQSLGRVPAQTVNKYFREFVSPLSVESELLTVKDSAQIMAGQENSLKVRAALAGGEVIAEYTVDETTMRLVVAMPPDWPLTVPQVTLDKAVVANERAKKWLLQLTAFLFHQNGSMVEGMVSWRQQVDRDVSGAEACTICMMTIHTTSHQLPRVKCKQCKNKFHSNCLYKWFESSNQSSCPLCRANFT